MTVTPGDQGARHSWTLERLGVCEGAESQGLLILLSEQSVALSSSSGSGLLSQVVLRVRPISVAELEEGATLIAHKVDEQVRGAAARS